MVGASKFFNFASKHIVQYFTILFYLHDAIVQLQILSFFSNFLKSQ